MTTVARDGVRGHPLPTSAISAFPLRPLRPFRHQSSPSGLTPFHSLSLSLSTCTYIILLDLSMDFVYSQSPGKRFPSLFLWELPYQVCLVDYHCRTTQY